MKTINKFYALVTLLVSVCTAHAQTPTPLFYDTFQQYSPGLSNGSIGDWTSTVGNESLGRIVAIRSDTSNYFGQGSSYKYVQFSKLQPSSYSSSVNLEARNLFEAHSVITLSFTYYEPTLSGEPEPFRIYLGKDGSGGTNLAGMINFRNGSVGSADDVYDLDSPIRFDIVINNSNSSYVYEDNTLNSASIDVYVEGIKILTNAEFTKTGNSYLGDISSIRFFYASDSTNTRVNDILLGEIAVFEGAVIGAPIPEPTTAAALLGILITGGLLVRRHFHRQT